MLISLREYAEAHGRAFRTARQMAETGGFKTAQKIGRNWCIAVSGSEAKKRGSVMLPLLCQCPV